MFNNWQTKPTNLFRHLFKWKCIYQIGIVYFQDLSSLKHYSINICFHFLHQELTAKWLEQKKIWSSDLTAFPAKANHISLDFGLSGRANNLWLVLVAVQFGTQQSTSCILPILTEINQNVLVCKIYHSTMSEPWSVLINLSVNVVIWINIYTT